jgi:hypothetical protein
MTRSTLHAWWSDLRHTGLVVAPALLEEYFPQGPVQPLPHSYQNLRDRYAAFSTWYQNPRTYEQGAKLEPLYTWLDWVLETFLGHDRARWQKGPHIAPQWKHDTVLREHLSPQRVLFRDHTRREPALFVAVEHTPVLGRGQGRQAYGKLLELLRAKNVKLGLLTNGRQFRLCYAGLDYDSWVEWDIEAWFAEEELRRQLYGFYTLLGPAGMSVTQTSFPLLEAAEASRTRQGELSTVLGEQVREAVELLLNEINQAVRSDPALLEQVRQSPRGLALSEKCVLEALYQAAVRVIMRLVIILFAEARDMLPRSLATYYDSYGLEGLYEQLRRAEQSEGRAALEERSSAWTRLLSLFTMIYSGSLSSKMPVREYGGLLFRPGEATSPDAILRAMTLFESLEVKISDAAVLHLLSRLKNGRVRVGQGRGSRIVPGPVDFSELRTEYIGLMYQGLLDFNLHTTNEAMVFLNLGQEPILPLSFLENMTDQHLRELLKKLSTEKSKSPVASEGEEDAEEEDVSAAEELPGAEGEEEEAAEEENGEEEAEEAEEPDTQSEADRRKQRAVAWAARAVEAAGLLKMKKPKSDKDGALYLYEKERTRRAQGLIKRVLDEQEFYLVRRGGTRKGSGTFYTRPQLSVPITQRTLEPLLHTSLADGTRVPRKPEEILAIKVCDPACGSASFLVAALHYITDVLFQALIYHARVRDLGHDGSAITLTLPFGASSRARPEEELLPERPSHEHFEARTKARLRRYVVERCIYGVDLSPLAVELARMSLWIETLDDELPFTFLDHKIKVGNALVGGWFDTFREYPIMAWMRDGGDASHKNGVRYDPKEWTNAINKMRNDVIKPALIRQIESSSPQLFLFSEDKQLTPEGLHTEITTEMEQIHALPLELASEREARYRALQQRTEYQEMKRAFDSWCAAWFWPADELAQAPTPATFYALAPTAQAMVDELADELHFFHWEIEFPDVFARTEHGFDAVLANPPWDIAKSISLEFFSDYDPLYRTYGRQEAINEQQHLFEIAPDIERNWLRHQSYFKSMNNWVKQVSSPFGDPLAKNKFSFTLKSGRYNELLHAEWRQRRSTYNLYSDSDHPYSYQGASGAGLNTYKMFLEISHHLLKEGGFLGVLVPSGVYTDQGSIALRKLFLDQCRWLWIFGFINWKRVFDIDSRFKFAVVLLEKGGKTENLQVAFNQVDLADLEQPEVLMLSFPRKQVQLFSPKSLTLVEPQSQHDLDILGRLYSSKTVLFDDQGEKGWGIRYTREFNMTDDSALFPPLPQWEAKGYQSDDYGRWIDGEGNIALPLYEGRMIGFFNPSRKRWISGKGRIAVWRDIPFEGKSFGPQYLLSLKTYFANENFLRGNKIGFMRVGSATNARSMYSALIGDIPCGHTVPTIRPERTDIFTILSLSACFNSFTYDYLLRCRLGGIDISYFILAETPLIPPARIRPTICAQLAARLNLIMPSFAPQWLEMRAVYPELGELHWRGLWAITEHERLRLRCILDAIIAELYGLEYDDFAWILRDDPSNPKGFWRVDKEKPRELRQTTLALAAFKRLKEVGLEAFSQEDWQFPAEIGAQLGPRFTPWQAELTIEESWAECEEHARRMKELPMPLPEEQAVTVKAEKKISSQPVPLQLWDQD